MSTCPSSRGKNYILTVVDRFSKWMEAIPLRNATSEAVAKEFWNNWVTRYGCPARITTDQGRQFEAQLFAKLSQITGTTRVRTPAYHPQANGLIERLHGTIKAAIRCHPENSWPQTFPAILLGFRAAVHEETLCSAADLVFGSPLQLPAMFSSPGTTRQVLTNSWKPFEKPSGTSAPLHLTVTPHRGKPLFAKSYCLHRMCSCESIALKQSLNPRMNVPIW